MMPREFKAMAAVAIGTVVILTLAALVGLDETATGYLLAAWLSGVLYFGVFRPDLRDNPRR